MNDGVKTAQPQGEGSAAEELDRLRRRNEKLTSLLDVAKALTAERNLDNLLDLILKASVRTVDAERGSLFIMDRDREKLWSKIAHGLNAQVISLPVGTGIAGHVAETGLPLNIPDAYGDARFNREVDGSTGYRTRSILCVPMVGSKREVVGVVQALNHKNGPFTDEDQELLMALGANAAAAIENANLYDEIERLFEGFVQASVTAIESRDPTTSGHSGRVAAFSVTLLDALPRSSGPYRHLTFSQAEIREMRYASLLHDFGKVGVREAVLVKAEKLYPHELKMLEQRFYQVRQAAELAMVRAKLECTETGERRRDRLEQIDLEWRKRDQEFEAMLEFIRQCNRPTVLERGGFDRLNAIAEVIYRDPRGVEQRLLTHEEVKNLSIARGSLNEEERREIESHVVHTYNFLKQIPWTRDLARVPEIAHGHHEKLDGSGYPLGRPALALPVQTRIMTVADIYDALTAADRPYKSAVPHERALSILDAECKKGLIDPAILEVFIEADVAHRALAPAT